MRALALLLLLASSFELGAAQTTRTTSSTRRSTSTTSSSCAVRTIIRTVTTTAARTTITTTRTVVSNSCPATSSSLTTSRTSTTSTSSTSRSSTSPTSSSSSTRTTSTTSPTSSTSHTSSTRSTSSSTTSTTSSSSSPSTSSPSSTSSRTTSSTTPSTSSSGSTSSTSTSTTRSTTTTQSTTSTTSTASSASATPTRNSGRRGLSFNDATLTQPFSLSGQGSKISWAYNWASQPYFPGSQTATNAYNKVLTFVPMLWSGANDLTSIWNANVRSAIANYGADAVLAFNEPDGCCWECGNSCMSVSEAVSAYRQWIQPLAGQVALGAPAVTNGLAEGTGLSYLSYFMGNCTGCTVDFVPLHWYGSVLEPGSFTGYVQGAYQRFGKPIWITEFAPQGGSEAQALDFMRAVLPWLDAQSYVVRYAYFMDRAAGFPYLMETDGKNMTSVGKLYNSS